MSRTIPEMAEDIYDEASEPRPNLAAIKRIARNIRDAGRLPADNVWARIGQKANEGKATETNATNLLRELVTLKRMSERIDTMAANPIYEQAGTFAALQQEYNRRKPLAWAAAKLLFPEEPKL